MILGGLEISEHVLAHDFVVVVDLILLRDVALCSFAFVVPIENWRGSSRFQFWGSSGWVRRVFQHHYRPFARHFSTILDDTCNRALLSS